MAAAPAPAARSRSSMRWGIAFTQYGDAACQVPVLTATLRGTYEPTAPSGACPARWT